MTTFKDFLNPNEDSLAYAITAAKLMADLSDAKDAQEAFLPKLLGRLEIYPDSEALLFYSAKFLFKLGKCEHICSHLIAYLRKGDESRWAWTFLGRALKPLDECLATACICRAMLLPQHREFRVDTKIELLLIMLKLRAFRDCYRLLSKRFYEEGAPLADEVLEFELESSEKVFAEVI